MSERSAQEVLRDLETGAMTWGEVREILRQEKTHDRFDDYRATLRATTRFGDRVVLRLGEYLFVVTTGSGAFTVACGECGHEFGDPRVNWKLAARVRVRRTLPEFMEVYLYEEVCPEEGIAELREYLCPGCFTLLSVECTPIGYPPVFEFLPDLASLFTDILHQPAPTEDGTPWVFEDRTMDVVRGWAAHEQTNGAVR